MFEKLDSGKKTHNVIKQILEAIESGSLRENDKLPNEQTLAQTFGVSRSVIRESMSVLVNMGIVKRRPGQGTFVQNAGDASVPIASTKTVLWSYLEELGKVEGSIEAFFARLLIEPVIAEYAAYKLDYNDIKKLEGLYHEMEEAVRTKDVERYHEADLQFHLYLGKASKNSVLSGILKDIIESIGFEHWDSERIWREESKPLSKSLEGHREILDLMVKGEVERVREKVEEHLKLSFYEHMS